MITEPESRILAALDEVTPDNCPVRDGHPKMHSTCAVCGAEPLDTREPSQPSPLSQQLSALSARAEPGSFWWEFQVGQALRAFDADRLEYLVQMADRNAS